jgi:hypothetical protein
MMMPPFDSTFLVEDSSAPMISSYCNPSTSTSSIVDSRTNSSTTVTAKTTISSFSTKFSNNEIDFYPTNEDSPEKDEGRYEQNNNTECVSNSRDDISTLNHNTKNLRKSNYSNSNSNSNSNSSLDEISSGNDDRFCRTTTSGRSGGAVGWFASAATTTTTSSSSSATAVVVGVVGYAFADLRTLAVCLKDTAGGVANFVHTTAVNVAKEIAALDDDDDDDIDNNNNFNDEMNNFPKENNIVNHHDEIENKTLATLSLESTPQMRTNNMDDNQNEENYANLPPVNDCEIKKFVTGQNMNSSTSTQLVLNGALDEDNDINLIRSSKTLQVSSCCNRKQESNSTSSFDFTNPQQQDDNIDDDYTTESQNSLIVADDDEDIDFQIASSLLDDTTSILPSTIRVLNGNSRDDDDVNNSNNNINVDCENNDDEDDDDDDDSYFLCGVGMINHDNRNSNNCYNSVDVGFNRTLSALELLPSPPASTNSLGSMVFVDVPHHQN